MQISSMSLLLGIAIHLNRHQRYLLIISVLTWHAITQQSTTLRMHAIHIPPFHFTRYSGSGTEIIHIASETTDRPQVYTWQYYLSHFNINQNSYIVLESATLWQESMLMSLPKSLARDHIYMPRQIQPQNS